MIAPAKSDERYWVDYVVSDRITDDQIYGVAYGMLIDFERGYEEYQNILTFGRLSGFAPADLPSDHFGFWAGRNAYEAEVIKIPAQARAKMITEGYTEHQAAIWANQQRRLIGIKYKDMTAPNILKEIYRRNLEVYGDELGPTMKYYENRRYSDAQIIASSGKPGGKDFIAWVVKNTGWDIKNWASWSP